MQVKWLKSNKRGTAAVVLIVLVSTCALGWGTDFIRNFCHLSQTRYENRVTHLEDIRSTIDTHAPAKTWKALIHAGVPLLDIIMDFPGDENFSGRNKDNLNEAITAQINKERMTQTQAEEAVIRIWGILLLQVFFFCIAIIHTVITGDLIQQGFFRETNKKLSWLWPACRHAFSHISDNSTSILMTLGIGGTFWGLMIGMGNSLSGEVAGLSVASLFVGLKISFTSTLAGIVLSIVVRILQQAYSGPSATLESLQADINKLRESLEGEIHGKVIDIVKGHYDGAVSAMTACSMDMQQCSEQLVQVREDLQSCVIDIGKYRQATRKTMETFDDIANINGEQYEVFKKIGESINKSKRGMEPLVASMETMQEQLGEIVGLQNDYTRNLKIYSKGMESMSKPDSVAVTLAQALEGVTKEVAELRSHLQRDNGRDQ